MVDEEGLRNEFLTAKSEWEDAAFALHRAKARYDFAEKSLVLAREQLLINAMRTGHAPDAATITELRPVEYLGKTIKQAAQQALYELQSATIDTLAEHMMQRGFQFSAEVPVRELHGALVKQPWAWRNGQTGEWEYMPQ
jgi:hypothetical protein